MHRYSNNLIEVEPYLHNQFLSKRKLKLIMAWITTERIEECQLSIHSYPCHSVLAQSSVVVRVLDTNPLLSFLDSFNLIVGHNKCIDAPACLESGNVMKSRQERVTVESGQV